MIRSGRQGKGDRDVRVGLESNAVRWDEIGERGCQDDGIQLGEGKVATDTMVPGLTQHSLPPAQTL